MVPQASFLFFVTQDSAHILTCTQVSSTFFLSSSEQAVQPPLPTPLPTPPYVTPLTPPSLAYTFPVQACLYWGVQRPTSSPFELLLTRAPLLTRGLSAIDPLATLISPLISNLSLTEAATLKQSPPARLSTQSPPTVDARRLVPNRRADVQLFPEQFLPIPAASPSANQLLVRPPPLVTPPLLTSTSREPLPIPSQLPSVSLQKMFV
eukprot:RCo014997